MTPAAIALLTLLVEHNIADAETAAMIALPSAIYLGTRQLLAALDEQSIRPGVWSCGTIVALCYPIFFGAGFLQYLVDDRSIDFGVAGAVDSNRVLMVIVACSIVASGIVLGDAVSIRIFRHRLAKLGRWSVTMPFFILAQMMALLAAIGAVATIADYGSLDAAATALSQHDRNIGLDNAGSVGSTFWGIFALPAALALAMILTSRTSNVQRAAVSVELAFILGYGVGVAGSRLLVVTTIFGFLYAYGRATGQRLRILLVLVGAIGLILVSGVVTTARASAQNTQAPTILESLSYSIFDIAVAADWDAPTLGRAVASPSRNLLALSSALPGSGNRASEISSARLDVIFVQEIGTTAQALSSGLPPSLPVAFSLGWGMVGGTLLGFAFGAVAGTVTAFLTSLRGDTSVMFLSLFGAFVFNVFKDGDVSLDLGSEARRWVYVVLLYGVAAFIDLLRSRKRVAQA